MAIEVRVNVTEGGKPVSKLLGHIKPGDPWTIGDGDPIPNRTMWHAMPGNKRKVPLLLFTRKAAEFYVGACAGHIVT